MKAWRRLLLGLVLALAVPAALAGLTPPDWQRPPARAVLDVPGWLADCARLDRVDQRSEGVAPSAQAPLPDIAALWRSAVLLFDDGAAGEWGGRLRVLAGLLVDSFTRLAEAVYERLPGRLGEAVQAVTAEDAYAARIEREYLLASRGAPWYRYDFVAPLQTLWTALPAPTEHGVRRWERRYLLTTVWGGRAVAAGVARALTPAEDNVAQTALVVDRWLAPLGPAWPDLQRVRSFADGSQLLRLPRRGEVTTRLLAIALEGADFIEIAGNGEEAPILVAVRTVADWVPEQAEAELLHVQPVIGRSGEAHFVLRTSVGSLARQLREFQASGVLVEKVFDY